MHEVDFGGIGAEVKIFVGVMPDIIINKLYGPTAACDLKVRIDLTTGEWVIERERYINDETAEWVEVVRIPMQASDDFLFQDEPLTSHQKE